MYCSTCGNQIADHLNYCNSCGARVEKNPLVISNAASPQLAKSLGFIVAVGIFGFVGVLKILLDNPRIDTAAVVLILIAYLATLFLICGMMVGHMWKHSGDIRIKSNESPEPEDYASPRSFRPLNTSQLEAANQPIMSVTEHTTRTLEELPIARKQTSR